MSEPAKPTPEPLPFADLLAALQERGLPVGARDHLAVAKLVGRWDDTDIGSLKNALAAVLARNAADARLVREMFDQLYAPDEQDVEFLRKAEEILARRRKEKGPPEEPAAPAEAGVGQKKGRTPAARLRIWLRRAGQRRWLLGLAVAVLLGVLGYLTWDLFLGFRALPDPPEVPNRPGARPVQPTDSVPPIISKIRQVPDPDLILATSAAAAAALFFWLWVVRTGQQSGQLSRRFWGQELDKLPDPQEYSLPLADLLESPFSAALLDEVARVLSRHSFSPGTVLDVDRTLDRTLRAGLAPQVVMQPRTLSYPLLVVEETGDEMDPFRPRVSAFLEGLAKRGVLLDVWRLHPQSGRLRHASGKRVLSLERLERLHPASPLLVIGTGQGLRRAGKQEAWTEILRRRTRRAWAHPAVDLRYRRPELWRLDVPVWPMSPGGLSGMARQLAQGARLVPQDRTPPESRVVALDVERLRWLLSLTPRRTPEIAELLRQEFCPWVPADALIEALAAPPPAAPPAVGPSAEEVRAFLWKRVFQSPEPPARNAGHERWRLDRAVLSLQIPGREELALAELRNLAGGPMALEVEHAVAPLAASGELPGPVRRQVQKSVLRRLRRRAAQQGFAVGEIGLGKLLQRSLPTPGELVAALIFAGLVFALLPRLGGAFQKGAPVELLQAYRLTVENQEGPGPFTLRLTAIPRMNGPGRVQLFRDGEPFGSAIQLFEGSATHTVDDEDERGAWFHAQAEMGEDVLAVSNKEYVGRGGDVGSVEITAVDQDGRSIEGVNVELIQGGSAQAVGVTPLTIFLPFGNWGLQATHPDFITAEYQFRLSPGDRDPWQVRLRRKPEPPPPVTEPDPNEEDNSNPAVPAFRLALQPVTPERKPIDIRELDLPEKRHQEAPGSHPVEVPPKPGQGTGTTQPEPLWSPETIREAIAATIKKHRNRSWLREGEIPDEDVAVAREKAGMPPDEKAIAAINNSVEDEAAFVFGERGIYYHHPREDTGFLPYDEGFIRQKSARVDELGSWEVHLGNGEEFNVAGSGMNAVKLSAVLNDLRTELRKRLRSSK